MNKTFQSDNTHLKVLFQITCVRSFEFLGTVQLFTCFDHKFGRDKKKFKLPTRTFSQGGLTIE